MSPYVYERLLASPCVAAGRRLQLRALAKRDRDRTPAWVLERWLGSGPWGLHSGPPPRRLVSLGVPPTLGGLSFPHGCPRGLRSLPERPELRPLLCWSLEISRTCHLFTRPIPEEALGLMSPSAAPPLEWLLGPFTAVDGRQRDDIAVCNGTGVKGLPGTAKASPGPPGAVAPPPQGPRYPVMRSLEAPSCAAPRRDVATAVGALRCTPTSVTVLPAIESLCRSSVPSPKDSPSQLTVPPTEDSFCYPTLVPPGNSLHRLAVPPSEESRCRTAMPVPLRLEVVLSGSELDSFRSALFLAGTPGGPYGEPGFPSFAEHDGGCADRHRLSFVGTAVARRAAAPGGPDRGDMEQHLANMYSALQHELPDFFRKKHNYGLYSQNVVFLVEFLRLKTRGVVLYQLSVSLLHLLSLLYFAYAHVEVLSLTRHDASASLQARWRLRGLPLHVWLLRFYRKDKTGLYRYYDAHSTFFVGPDGLIHCHKVDKLMPVNPTERKLTTGLTLGLLGLLGLREERPALSLAFPLLAPLARAAASAGPAPSAAPSPCAGGL